MTRRGRIGLILLLAAGLQGWVGAAWSGMVVVVAHANVRKLDALTVQRIYTGRVVVLDGIPVSPVNLVPGHLLRQRFLAEYLMQDEQSYLAYWTVRRYVGKGVPPRELASTADVIQYVLNTPGAVAYLDEAEVPPGMNIVLRARGAASSP